MVLPVPEFKSEPFDDHSATKVVIKYYGYDGIDVKQMM